MKITFPHIGDAHLTAGLLFREIGIEIVTPPSNTLKGLEEGSALSPDEICLPFKLMISNLTDAYKQGADTVIMPATMGPCRLGEYGELFKSILDKNGYSFDWILLDSPQAIGKRELLKRLAKIVQDSDKHLPFILRALHKTNRLIYHLEELEKQAHILCGYEVQKGDCRKILDQCKKELAKSENLNQALRIVKRHRSILKQIPLDPDKTPLHLLLTGEIYSLIEPFGNHHMEDLLMDMGVSFEKRITLGWWIRLNITNPLGAKVKRIRKNKFLDHSIGGYARETVEEGILCSRENYDGVIQVFPVGCMPEIVAKAVFSRMSKELDISVLTVIYDEMGGEAGYITRIEAFIDMLSRRKRIRQKSVDTALKKHGRKKVNVLFGN
ncbi:2-hydroxyglutaryl-CoA dehydratase [Sinanaerobacter chloroacetimidivorans]|uniref:2-hydroxyglutaryl-CoA dehydratase n=1 Tax=Sinanaerobacter chloroacetimidivorans TaxID=2818044 RepID=A0A8J8B5K6_9FIRM|nr:2-hydroxyglutaryl-CoA dehydratase [Sinanaerobacter chloroacetimidivorans]MBR0600430.1 2-hydroxyglutaryl-CoA dehydratase [Sinanaerobacter chloroacetimidivorans]